MRRSDHNRMNGRIAGIALTGLLVVALFCVRLLYLQILSGGDIYRNAAYAQKWKSIPIAAERGKIYDRQGKILATSVVSNNCYLLPEYVDPSERAALQETLVSDLQIDEDVFKDIWEKKGSLLIKKTLSEDEIRIISEKALKGVVVQAESARSYPEFTMAAHLIGHTDQDNEGAYGLEKRYEDVLEGTDGLRIIATDPRGGIIATESSRTYPAQPGQSLYLTIDLGLQTLVDQAIQDTVNRYQPKGVTVIVSDPNTGAILAMQNAPSYDPNTPFTLEGTRIEEKDDLYRLWRNSAVSDNYEPGSVYKLVTAAVALEENTATLESEYTCDGFVRDIPGVVIRCHRFYEPHGRQTFGQALANSCNPAFVEIARSIGEEKMYAYRQAFGFGRRTGIDLPAESQGIVRPGVESVGAAELATMSYGHGFSASPIQVLTASNAVINGGKIYTPYVVEQIKDVSGNVVENIQPHLERQVISEETSTTMRALAELNVTEGASSGADIKGYRILGKSGTSIKLVDGVYDSDTTVASYFAAYPADAPRYSLLVVVDEPQVDHSGNGVAGSLARGIIQALIEMDGKGASQNKGEEEKTISVPDVTGMALVDAVKALEKVGLKHALSQEASSGEVDVLKQSPNPWTKLAYGDTVTLDVASQAGHRIEMPKVLGLPLLEAVAKLEKAGLSVNTKGLGLVVEQIPMAGTLVDPEKDVEITADKVETEIETEAETEDQAQTGKTEDEKDNKVPEGQPEADQKKKDKQKPRSETEAIEE